MCTSTALGILKSVLLLTQPYTDDLCRMPCAQTGAHASKVRNQPQWLSLTCWMWATDISKASEPGTTAPPGTVTGSWNVQNKAFVTATPRSSQSSTVHYPRTLRLSKKNGFSRLYTKSRIGYWNEVRGLWDPSSLHPYWKPTTEAHRSGSVSILT